MTTPTASPAIEISGLHKRFGRTNVLAGLDAVVERGRVTALVGPNAAGKSTLLKCLLGLARPDAGTIRIEGRPVTSDPAYAARSATCRSARRFPTT